MKTEHDTITFETGDKVERFLIGRTFKKVPKEGEEPCIFAFTKACDFNTDNGVCKCKGQTFMWAELVAAGTSKKRKAPLVRCRHCGKFHEDMQPVGIGEGKTEMWCAECRAAESKLCPKCGKIHASYLFFLVKGAPAAESQWCTDCCNTHAKKCPRCGNYAVLAGMVDGIASLNDSGEQVTVSWCSDCARRNASRCETCHGLGDTRHMGSHNGRTICPTCIRAAGMTRCANCGNLTSNPPNSRGRAYCDNCRANGHGSPIYGYHNFTGGLKFWKHGDKSSNSDSGDLYLGFELEAGGASSAKCTQAADALRAVNPAEDRFHMEHDGTIPEYGFELISAPHTLAAHLEYKWKDVLKNMVKFGMRSHDLDGKCGLHVHVSKAFLTGPDMAKLDLFVLKNREFWEKIARRNSSHYSQFLVKPVRQHGKAESVAGRYAAVNFCNARTVELRIFRGTLNYDTLIGTLALVDGMCRWVKTRNSVEILKNDKETDRFYGWLKSAGPEYASAVAYIDKRNALSTEGEL